MVPDPSRVAVLLGAGLVCGVANAIVSSGSAVTLPVLIFLGLPTTVANGTNRVTIVAGAAGSLLTFHRRGAVDWSRSLRLCGPCVLGSLLGAWCASRLDPPRLDWAVVAALIMAFGVILLNRKLLVCAQSGAARPPRVRAGHQLLFLAIGAWSGFIGVHSAIVMLLALVVGVGFRVVEANAAKALLLVAVGLSSLAVFSASAEVDWADGLLALGSAVGEPCSTVLACRMGGSVDASADRGTA
jgi:uncharacterized membrane protein YfcA